MREVLYCIFDNCRSEIGEAMFEFLFAIATGKLRLKTADLASLVKHLQQNQQLPEMRSFSVGLSRRSRCNRAKTCIPGPWIERIRRHFRDDGGIDAPFSCANQSTPLMPRRNLRTSTPKIIQRRNATLQLLRRPWLHQDRLRPQIISHPHIHWHSVASEEHRGNDMKLRIGPHPPHHLQPAQTRRFAIRYQHHRKWKLFALSKSICTA